MFQSDFIFTSEKKFVKTKQNVEKTVNFKLVEILVALKQVFIQNIGNDWIRSTFRLVRKFLAWTKPILCAWFVEKVYCSRFLQAQVVYVDFFAFSLNYFHFAFSERSMDEK